ncbi:MAG: methionine synthase [Bacillota bacterium]
MRKLVLGLALGDCVHVAGLHGFLRLAATAGYDVKFLGPAVPVDRAVAEIARLRPEIAGISYRLSPEAAGRILGEFAERLRQAGLSEGQRLAFGGTPPVARVAESTGLFERVFGGDVAEAEVLAYLSGEAVAQQRQIPPGKLLPRLAAAAPRPLLRHHFGVPSLEETVAGIAAIAEAGVLDVISIGPDQNAQACFFRQDQMDPAQDGAGGVPLRTAGDLRRLKAASARGNHPLLRCYSGTQDVVRFAEVLSDTIDNAWAAIPLCWYNLLDSRGRRGVEESIGEAQLAMAWHAAQGIPVEVNEAHHWSLRDAPDTVAVAAAYLAAYNAKAAGVRDYIAQFMFNTPPGTSPRMDLAKMLAKLDLIGGLADEGFRVYRQVRAGLSSFPADPDLARGHLASAVAQAIALRPDIVHVVGYCEADHAATAADVIASCKLARGVLNNLWHDSPDASLDQRVQERRRELVGEAAVLLATVHDLGEGHPDPFIDPATLAKAIRLGLLDAPHLKGNPHAAGKVETALVEGACRAVSGDRVLSEMERIEGLLAASHA